MKGHVTEAHGDPAHHSYTIKGQDTIEYFVHLGDIKENEDKLYGKHTNPTTYLAEGDQVEFDLDLKDPPKPRAIHVKRSN